MSSDAIYIDIRERSSVSQTAPSGAVLLHGRYSNREMKMKRGDGEVCVTLAYTNSIKK